MQQSKLESFIESCINIASGFVISLLVWTFIVSPLWGFETSFVDNFGITMIFTVSSIARSYFWRRFFNAGLHKAVHRWVSNFWRITGW